jgi:cytochrome c-type biogenesis protein CcsB
MTSHLTRILLGALLLVAPLSAQVDRSQLPFDATADLAIVADGRLKPIDTFANEVLLQVSGRRVKQTDGVTALEYLWGLQFAPDDYLARPYIKVDNNDLKGLMGLDRETRRFSFGELAGNAQLSQQASAGFDKSQADAPVSAIERDAMRVWNKLGLIDQVVKGTVVEIVPIIGPNQEWSPASVLADAAAGTPEAAAQARYEELRRAFLAGDAAGFGAAAEGLKGALRGLSSELYPPQEKMDLEVRYNNWDTFGKASWLYLAGFLAILAFARAANRTGYGIGYALVALGFVGHSVGFGMRWMIAGRAPVSDMYESLVFMGWGVIGIGLVLELVYRKGYFGMAAGALGFLALAFARYLPPTVMNSAISPLMPVLRNTSWLSIHVMTIMLSYSAFALAMGIGHIVMFKQLYQPGRTAQLKTLSTLLYKTVQVGVLFLAAGIAFGAIWANESWGRYWGWDPKETWSAITFAVYLAVIHARYAGWIHNFGLAATSIASFMAVLFTYYGVNFVLGAGLHAYGRGSGGKWAVAAYLLIELAIVLLAWWRYQVGIRTGRIARPVED